MNRYMINVILKWVPISTQHAYWQSGKIRYMTADAKSLKNAYILQARMQYKGDVLKTPLSTYIRLYFKDNRVRDIDNYGKILLDSLTWIIYEDDKQIKLMTIQIMPADKTNPRIEIIIDQLD
jgi:crossover junction endodeoxyribonuclease RusA